MNKKTSNTLLEILMKIFYVDFAAAMVLETSAGNGRATLAAGWTQKPSHSTVA